MYLEADQWDEEEFDAYLHMWQLSYGDTSGPGLMQVTPNPVPVGDDGMGLVSVSITGLPLPDTEDVPPTRCAWSGTRGGFGGFEKEQKPAGRVSAGLFELLPTKGCHLPSRSPLHCQPDTHCQTVGHQYQAENLGAWHSKPRKLQPLSRLFKPCHTASCRATPHTAS